MSSRHRTDGRLTLRLRATLMLGAGVLALLLAAFPSSRARASSISPVGNDDAGALALAQATIADPATLVGARFASAPPFGTPHGVASSLSFFPTGGPSFAMLTTGNASYADAPNTSGNAGADIGGPTPPGRGTTAFDVSVLQLDLVAPSGANCLRLDFAFYSEEFPEWVGTPYNDAFIAELDRSTWSANQTISAPDNFAFDPKGQVVSINSTGATSMNDVNAGGTTYDGATALLEAATPVAAGRHALYLSIFDQGDHIYDSAAFVDNVRFEHVADPATDCRPGARQKRTPLIFLPGIGGSQLVNKDGVQWVDAQRLFDSDDDKFLEVLRLAPDGVSPFDPNDARYTSVRLGDILRTLHVDVIGPISQTSDVYAKTIELLQAAGYKENTDLFVFPFDWRKDMAAEAGRLLTRIDEVRQQTGAPQVDILAHSQGGLVTRAALANPASVGKIRHVLTMGTPVLGATKALGVLEYQMPCFTQEVPIKGCLLNQATAQEVLTNFPGAYELLPSRGFDQAEVPPLVIDRDTNGDGKPEGVQRYAQWSQIVAAHRNANVLAQADGYHQRYDNLVLADPSVKFYRVVGDSLATPQQVREYETDDCILWFFNCHKVVRHEILYSSGTSGTGGDGTVPLHSADLYNAGSGFDLRNGVPNVYAHKVEHGELPKDGNVMGFAVAFFGGKVQMAQSAVSALGAVQAAATEATGAPRVEHDPWSDPPRTTMAAGLTAKNAASATAGSGVSPEDFGLGTAPQPFGGIELETLGPVSGAVQDHAGRVLGTALQPPTSAVDSIPHGSHTAIGDTQSFFLNDDGTYQSTLRVTGDGTIRLRVRTYAGNQLDGQSVFHVNPPAGALLRLGFATGQDLAGLRLQIDRDADGTVDQELAPDSTVTGAAADDTQPPATEVAFVAVAPRQSEVTLTAGDGARGSGVAATYYLLDGASTAPQRYTRPFVVPFGTIVHYLSVDRAGNVERVQSVVVDDAPNTLKTAAPLKEGDHIRRTIDPQGDEDWFSFDADGVSTYRAQLMGLPADYDLELYDAAGQKLMAPARRGRASEEIRAALPAGRYYLRVSGYAGAWDPDHHYQLQLQTLGR